MGQSVTVAGSVAKSRNMGGLIFTDLRDTSGIVQLAFGDGTDPAVFEKASGLHAEYVVVAKGILPKAGEPQPRPAHRRLGAGGGRFAGFEPRRNRPLRFGTT